jgi:hypothetical protein
MRKPAAILLALALGIALPACRSSGVAAVSGSPEPTASPSPTPATGNTPSPTSIPDESSPPPPGRSRCTLALGMSVTANWFLDGAFETLPGIEDPRWELIWASGHDMILYADPNSLPYSQTPLSPCAVDPDRVLFQIAARDWQSPDAVLAELRSSIDNIRATWPSANVIELIPIVGGPGGGPCFDPVRPDKGVLASMMYPVMTAAIAEVAGGDVVAGPALELEDCAQYRDGTGHLTIDGSSYIASILAERYGS